MPRISQKLLFDEPRRSLGAHGTFVPNHRVSVHRWYPYIEGFSAEFVQGILDEFAAPRSRVHDPFAGTGTTVTVAAANDMAASYSEINPLMRLVIECKTNSLRHVAGQKDVLADYFREIEKRSEDMPSTREAACELSIAFGDRAFFIGRRLVEIVALRRAILCTAAPNPAFLDFGRLALASIAVGCSEMKRAADLRYRTDSELLSDDVSPCEHFRSKTRQILSDIEPHLSKLPEVICLSESALTESSVRDDIDLVFTSPPYVNGTNYFRNTKLELWLTGFLKVESDLTNFTDAALAAGINNISSRGRPPRTIPAVEQIARRLDEVAYDRRIPELIRRYFSDSAEWIGNMFRLLKPGGRTVIDIGDSRFAGVHVPADELLAVIAAQVGFQVVEIRNVRQRKSKDGTTLKQVLIILNKPGRLIASKTSTIARSNGQADDYEEAAIEFGRTLPHSEPPYASRNWGHGLHSLCSYQGKLKPAIAHFLVKNFTSKGDRVLDPLSGSGAIPLEAFLQGREAIGNDLQELGYILTRAKVERGSAAEAIEVQDELLRYVVDRKEEMSADAFREFGFNGRIPDYFHEETYREVLSARQYMLEHPCDRWSRAVIYACALHILHGNRPYALSRRSHPVTPFKPSGSNQYRSFAKRLCDKVNRTLSDKMPSSTINGSATLGSFESIQLAKPVDVVITSPPFAASTRFFSSNWMRLWLAGWQPTDFTERRPEFIEHQQVRSMDIYQTFFSRAAGWLRSGGRLILHVGRTAKIDMAKELINRVSHDFKLVHAFEENVSGREKFGVRDQGATTSHQYLFLQRR